jgi:hypothetical protein
MMLLVFLTPDLQSRLRLGGCQSCVPLASRPWSLALSGCSAIQQLPATWSQTGVLTSFTAEPTTLKSLSHGVASYTVPSNGSVAIELALRRTSLARRVPPSGCLWRLTATWQGPASATRPRTLCLRAKGLSARGRLYPISPAIMTML